MKVVINRCFGGFSLSAAGEKRYLELLGKEAYFYVQTKYKHSGGVEEYEKTEPEDVDMFSITVTKDMGDIINEWPSGDDGYFYDRDIERDDEFLVQVVEELGEKANGMCAELAIVDVPDGTKYIISEYDGNEHIAEEHQTWY